MKKKTVIKRKVRLRNMMITINNVDDERTYLLNNLLDRVMKGESIFSYIVGQLEKGEKNGKLHYQLYVETKKEGHCYDRVKKEFGINDIHIERRRGSQKQAIRYCKKEETRVGFTFEEGEPKKQGYRSDIEFLKKDIKRGKNLLYIEDNHFELYLRYRSAIKESIFLSDIKKAKKFRKVDVYIYWGPTGSGKTKKADLENPDRYILKKGTYNNIWFDGYVGQKCLIIDEFDGWIAYSTLLKYLDGHEQTLDIKGGTTVAQWCKVVITTSISPLTWYDNGSLRKDLWRRIPHDNIIKFKRNDDIYANINKTLKVLNEGLN